MSVPGDLSELDAQIEEIFDRADDLMINKKEYSQAVSVLFEELLLGNTLQGNFSFRSGQHRRIKQSGIVR